MKIIRVKLLSICVFLLFFVMPSFNNASNITEIHSINELENLNHKSKALIFINSSNTNRNYTDFIKSIATKNNHYQLFYTTNAKDILEKFNLKENGLNILSQVYDNEGKNYGPIEIVKFKSITSEDEINDVLITYSTKPYGIMSDDEMNNLMQKGKPTLILIYGNETSEDKMPNIYEFMSELALQNRGELFMYNSTLQNQATSIIAEVLGFKKEDLPIAVIFQIQKDGEELQKFIMEKAQLTKENLSKFIADWKNGKLSPFLASEEEPSNPIDENGIHRLVGKSFEKFITQQGKDLILNICSNLSKRCLKFGERFARVAQKLAHNPNLAFGKIDPNLNEFSVEITQKLPQLIFIPSDYHNLTLKPKFENKIIFDGNFTTDQMIYFIIENARESLTVKQLKDEEKIKNEEEKEPITATKEMDQSDFNMEEFMNGELGKKLGKDFDFQSMFDGGNSDNGDDKDSIFDVEGLEGDEDIDDIEDSNEIDEDVGNDKKEDL
jgi:hypothetical protein